MKRFVLPLISFCILGLVLAKSAPHLQAAVTSNAFSSSSSQENAGAECTNDIDKALARERFLFETMLFGNRHATDEGPRATRIDEEGNTWIKNTEGEWVAEGKEAISDEEMDRKTAADPFMEGLSVDPQAPAVRLGILETQKALTSDLIPPILQGFRAFQCRLESLCEGIAQTVDTPAGSTSDSTKRIDIPGCQPMEENMISTCQPSPLFSLNDVVAARTYCTPVMKKLTNYEESQLLFLTHEDAAHRTLRQFAGFLEPLLVKLRFPFLSPLRQISNFIGEWSSVPCFLPYCAQ